MIVVTLVTEVIWVKKKKKKIVLDYQASLEKSPNSLRNSRSLYGTWYGIYHIWYIIWYIDAPIHITTKLVYLYYIQSLSHGRCLMKNDLAGTLLNSLNNTS